MKNLLFSTLKPMSLLSAGLLAATFTEAKPAGLPNIVLIFTDDLGYGDLSCYGATLYRTPNLDRLALQGMRFTNFYACQAVCSASRAALMTGCYSNRVGVTGALNPLAKTGLNPEEETIAEVLKKKSYKTIAIGKWHLGHHKQFLPLQQGFDEYLGIPYSNDMWPINYDGTRATAETNARKASFPELPLIHNNDKIREFKTIGEQSEITTIYTEKAKEFIKINRKNPFFLYLAHNMPHVPLAVSSKFKGKSEQGLYGDVITEIDWSVGEIIRTLEECGLTKNTLIIFTSDNGPWLNFGNHAGSAGGLREGKGTSWEGGQREPCIMRWPGVIPAGTICNELSSTIDLLPTFAGITGAPLPEKKIDGVNILSLLKGDFSSKPRTQFYYYYRQNSLEAVREGNWKLVLPHPGRTYEGFAPGKDGIAGQTNENFSFPGGLYDLRRDPGERYNVMELYPEVVARLQKIVAKAREDLGDDITGNPGKNRREPGKILN
jgi:arylsulfatase A-like enzyme